MSDARTLRAIAALREPDNGPVMQRLPMQVRQSVAEVIEDQQTALERAYGILWRDADAAKGHARKLLLEVISKDGQRRGIEYALEIFGPMTTNEVLNLDEVLLKD